MPRPIIFTIKSNVNSLEIRMHIHNNNRQFPRFTVCVVSPKFLQVDLSHNIGHKLKQSTASGRLPV